MPVIAIINQKGGVGKRVWPPTWLQLYGARGRCFYWTATLKAVHRAGLPWVPSHV